MPSPTNKRSHARVPIAFRARIIWPGGAINVPRALNVSLGGVLLATDARIPVGSVCHLVLFLVSDGDEYKVLAQATVVRQEAHALALRFLDLRGPDSLDNLETLIRFHTESPG